MEAVMYDDLFKNLISLYNNPLFQQTFSNYLMKMQQEGLESARKYWQFFPEKSKLADNAPILFEQMIDFYSNFGFVPRKKYDEVVKENEELRRENEFLKETIQKLNFKVMTEGGVKMQEAWKSTVEKQMDVSKEITKSFFDLFKLSDKGKS
jgi:regulator of replication initiation timing